MQKAKYILLAFFLFAGVAYAAPYYTFQPTILPTLNNGQDLGTSTQVWRNGYITTLCLSADCRSAWPAGGTGGSGTVSTSTTPTQGQLSFWSTTGAWPEKLGSVATTSVTCSGSTTCASFTAIGGAPITISSTAGGGSGTVATSSSETSGYIPTWSSTSATPATLAGTSQIFQTGINVGIGTTTPVAPLTIFRALGNNFANISDISTRSALLVRDSTNAVGYTAFGESGTATVIQAINATMGAGVNLSLNPFGGNIGIGSTTPSQLFSVQGNGLFSNNLSVAGLTATGTVSFATALGVSSGGTGQGTFTSSQLLYGNGTNALSGVATTTASCSGTVSCSGFTVIGSSPITLTGSASGGTGLATSSPVSGGNVLVYNSGGPGSAYGIATSTLGGSGAINVTAGAAVIASGAISVSCTNASGGVTGCLTGTDYNTFNGKENVITFTSPIRRISNTVDWTGLATTTQPSSSNLLTSNGGSGVYGTATSTLTASGPLTGSFTQVGSGGSLGCTTASSGVAGCLSNTAFDTFNNKQSAISVSAPIRLIGSAIDWTGLATTSQPSSSNVLVSNGTTGVFGVATTSATINNGLTGTLTTLNSQTQTIGLASIANGNVLGYVGAGSGVPTAQATSSLFGLSTGGFVLAWNNGQPQWVATSSIQNISLTTTGSSGAATLVGNTLNIPNYAGGGTTVVSTSTNETQGQIPFWTTTSGSPAKLGSIATTTLAFSGPFNGTAALGTLVGGSNSTVTYYGLATTTAITQSNLLYSTSGAGVSSVATNTLSGSGAISVTAGAAVISSGAISVSCATCLTANQTITLSGAVTGSGTTAITTSFGTLAQGVLGNPASAATIPTAQATSTLYGPALTISASTYNSGFASSTPWGQLSVNPIFGNGSGPSFVVGSSTGTKFIITNTGNIGVASTTPAFPLSVNNAGSDFYITSTGEVVGQDTINAWTGRISPTHAFALNAGTSTTWTASTTGSAYSPSYTMPITGIVRQALCESNSFLGVNLVVNGANATPSYFVASSTVGTEVFTAGNTFTKGQVIRANYGTTTTAASGAYVHCTIVVTETQ